MLRHPYDYLLNEQQNELQIISEKNVKPLEKLRESITVIKAVLEKLKLEVKENAFRESADEIYFFKKVKPQFYSEKIYALELYSLESCVPVGPIEKVKEFYQNELIGKERFFQAHSFYYQYYKMEMTELDEAYFLRYKSSNVLLDSFDVDPDFSTSLDYYFAKFIAYEKMRKTLITIINNIAGNSEALSLCKEDSVIKLKWTGDSINLVEIAYGIWLTGQINNGNASISEIVRFLEESLSVKIGRAHRRWTEIAQRKRNSYTKQLDNMRNAILERIDKELDIKVR